MMFDKEEIKKRLPHREPFLFVDSVEELTAGKSIVARFEARTELSFFRGHFP